MLKGCRILIDDVLRSRKIFRKDAGATIHSRRSAFSPAYWRDTGQKSCLGASVASDYPGAAPSVERLDEPVIPGNGDLQRW